MLAEARHLSARPRCLASASTTPIDGRAVPGRCLTPIPTQARIIDRVHTLPESRPGRREATRRRLAALALSALCVGAAGADRPARYLCKADETILFGCMSGRKMISVCASRGFQSDTGYVQYRYGVPAKVELLWPESLQPAADHFWRSSVPYSGGGESHLRFVNQGVEYVLFDRTIRTNFTPGEPNDPDMTEGVVVRVPGHKPTARLCTDGAGGIRSEAYLGLEVEPFDDSKVPEDLQ